MILPGLATGVKRVKKNKNSTTGIVRKRRIKSEPANEQFQRAQPKQKL